MAKKYYYNILCWYKGLDPINFSFSTFPMLCDGKVVGGLDEPFTTLSYEYETTSEYERTCRASSSAFSCTKQVGMSIYSGNYFNSELLILTDENSYNALNTWQDKNSTGGSREVQELETSTISGRYRFNNAVTSLSFPLMISYRYKLTDCYIGIPIKFALNNILHYGLRWTVNKSSSSSGWGIYTLQSNRVASITQDGINDISLNNQIVDFGDRPQEIPKSILDWITNNSDPVYQYKYTIKDSAGSNTLAELTDAPSMVKAKLAVVGNFKTLTLTGDNDKTYTMGWESVTPDNNTFNGLSVKQGVSVIIPANGTEVEVNLTGSTTFYENYSIYRPLTTDFSVELYQNRAESNRVDKTIYLTSVGTLKGVLRDSTSISSLELTIEYPKFPDFNYIHIPAFNRYYFVNDIVAENNNLWTLYCRVDVLMTYKDGLLQSKAYIDRTGIPGKYGDLIVDKQRAVQLGQSVNILSVPMKNDIFEATGSVGYRQGSFIITGIGIDT